MNRAFTLPMPLPVALLLLLPIPVMPEAQAQPYGMPELYRLDLLPRIRSSVFVGSVSSYDRTGGNDDGFSGKYSFVAREDDGLVIADLQGPGVIYRIWTPTPTEDMVEFFFDGESQPRIRVKFRELFTGGTEPFVRAAGRLRRRRLLLLRAAALREVVPRVACAKQVQFYQINYARYPDDAPARHVAGGAFRGISAAPATRGRAVCLLWARISAHTSRRPAARVRRSAQTLSLEPGATATLLQTDQPGRIVGLRIAPASALAGKNRDLLLRICWDERSNRRCSVLPAISSATPGADRP